MPLTDIFYDITKSQILSGIQCSKRLWLEVHHPEAIEELEDSAKALREAGREVGDLAQRLYPRGSLIFTEGFSHEDIYASTQEVLSDSSVPAIFDASFVHQGVNVRIPILERVGSNEFDIVSPNSAAEVEPQHVIDVALQAWVAKGSGVKIRAIRLINPNKGYIHKEDYRSPDPKLYFAETDVTDDVSELLDGIAQKAEKYSKVVKMHKMPVIDVGTQCKEPHKCSFYEGCHKRLSADPITDLPNLSPKLRTLLSAHGIKDISDIPEGFIGLSDRQRVIRDVVVSEKPKHDQAGMDRDLSGVKFPINFVDFETIMPAIPLYSNTSPYQTLPFQWSNHVLQGDGAILHSEFLHREKGDPRRDFCVTLIEALRGEGSVITYSTYEASNLRRLANDFPEFKEYLHDILSRIVDLLPVIKKNLYYPGFHGSYSLKKVLPVMVPELSYSDLDIQNGAVAATMYTQMSSPYMLQHRKDEIAHALLKYCERDTEAMMRIFLAVQPQLILERQLSTTEDQIPIIPAQKRNYHSKRDPLGRFAK